jgi:hypothetical protein
VPTLTSLVGGRCIRGAVIVSVVLLAGVVGPPGRGSTAPASESDFGLMVSPTRLVVAPGQVNDEQFFRVDNKGGAPLDVEVNKRDFVASTTGTMELQADAPYSASNWVTATPARFHLEPGAATQISVRIAVPTNPETGDHQVALVFIVPASNDGTTNIRVNRGIGVPVFVTVPGAVDDSAEIAALSAPRFVLSGPVTFAATLRDTGTVHRDFRGDGGRLTIDVDGRQVEFPDFTVVRGSSRDITAEWTDTPLWCFCQATVAIPRADGTTQQATVKVMILPLHLMAIGLAALLVLLLGGRFLRRRYRSQVEAAAAALHSSDGPSPRS